MDMTTSWFDLSTTWSDFFNFLLGDGNNSETIPILCKGDWYNEENEDSEDSEESDESDESDDNQENEENIYNRSEDTIGNMIRGRKVMEYLLKREITPLSQCDELVLKSKCAHSLMEKNGIVDALYNSTDDCFLYLSANYDRIQITILDSYGKLLDTYSVCDVMGTYSHIKIIDEMNMVSNRVYKVYGNRIKLIVGFDTIYHLLKKKGSPVLEDGSSLPEYITTSGKDFNKLIYLTNFYEDTPMIVVRKFRIKDGTMRKITYTDSGEGYFITLGNNSVKLVEPLKGNPIKSFKLPGDWQTNMISLSKIATYINELIKMAKDLENEDIIIKI